MFPAIRGAMRLLGLTAGQSDRVVPTGRTSRYGIHRLSGATVPGFFLSLACLAVAAFVLAPSPAAARSEGSLRIVPHNAGVPSTGRLEIFHTPAGGTGRWGPICDDSFRIEEATVACKQMGYRDAEDYIIRYGKDHAYTEAAFWLDDLDCNGTESKLTDCRRWTQDGSGHVTGLQWGIHNCNVFEQVGVQCTADTASKSILTDKRELTVVEGRSATFRCVAGQGAERQRHGHAQQSQRGRSDPEEERQ